MIKVLNLYAGIGGNRRYWENVDVTAVEYDKEIAHVYQDLFPDDNVIVGDAHEYLLEHFKDYDFIWASPPCPSHSCLRKMGCSPMGNQEEGQNKPIYPDMKLYEEILLLQHYYNGKWCIENVMPYYKPLIMAKKIQRHLFWSNYPLNEKKFKVDNVRNSTNKEWSEKLDIDLLKYNLPSNKQRYMYRNCVNSSLGKYVFDMAYKDKQETLL
tara:strand:+ start:88 stop:720 length:633 start_codon:yes stop_codon:yes gene_type:complete